METNVMYQNTEGQFNPQLPMSFHNFYKWYLIVVGVLALIPAFLGFGSDSGNSISFTVLANSALNIATGICLMKMMRAGKICQTVINILNIIKGSCMSLASLLFIFCGGLFGKYLEGSLASLTGGVFAGIGIGILIVAVAIIVINACILKYYEKRKFLFN